MIEPVETTPERRSGAFAIAVYALLIAGAWAALQLWGLGKTPFHTKGEPREGLVVWEMTHGGGWILPRRNGVELPSKPPLFHWLGALTSVAHGATDEWSIRFPSAVLSLFGLLCVFAAGTALWAPRAGLVAALALMTSFEWARAATNARVDMTLTFGLELAFLSLLFFLRSRSPRWLIPLYIGITLAVLGKGPVGAVLPGMVALLMLALTRDASFLRQMRLGYGALVVGCVAGSWYVMALVLGGWEFFRKQVLAENVFTFFNDPELGRSLGAGGHQHAAAYLLGALLLGLLPWTLFLPAAGARLWRQRRELSRYDPRVFLLIWIVVVFGFYSLAASKRSVYLLALYPAAALLLGWWWNEQSQAAPEDAHWQARLLSYVATVLMGVWVVTFLAVLLEALGAPVAVTAQHWLPPAAQPVAPWVSDMVRAERWQLMGFLLLAGTSLYACIRAARAAAWMPVFTTVFCAVAALLLSVQQVILPGIAQHQTLRSFMTDIRQVVGASDQLFFYKTFEYGAVFYWRGHIPTYDGPWPQDAPRFLLMAQDEWQRSEPLVKGKYQQVTFPGVEGLGENGPIVLIRQTDNESQS